MKAKIVLFLSIALVSALLFAAYSYKKSHSTQLAQSCCENGLATCTGSKSCSACKNCKYCKHCSKNGGTCGVCK